jgi:phosphoserine phosphatase
MRYKLICFDLDGTIIDETIFIWQTIHDSIGTDKKRRMQAMDDFHAKRISYSEWAARDVEQWKECGATKEKLLEAIRPFRLMPGAREVLAELKKKGHKLAIISGSIDIALEYVLPDYRDYFDDIFINRLLFNSDGTIQKIESTPYDFEHKASALKKICERENIHPKECVFVGDHNNDVKVAQLAGLSIAFNCKSERLAQVADVVVKKKDLREVLRHIYPGQ